MAKRNFGFMMMFFLGNVSGETQVWVHDDAIFGECLRRNAIFGFMMMPFLGNVSGETPPLVEHICLIGFCYQRSGSPSRLRYAVVLASPGTVRVGKAGIGR